MVWKLPPVEKIYEAFSVLADKRYEITGNGKASVLSSSGDKKYTVTWSDDSRDGLKVLSDDNASRWQGYTGYPIIAILMITGKIIYDSNIIRHFSGIPWNKLNKEHKNNYSAVADGILNKMKPEDSNKIKEAAENIFNQLSELNLVR